MMRRPGFIGMADSVFFGDAVVSGRKRDVTPRASDCACSMICRMRDVAKISSNLRASTERERTPAL